MKAITLKKVIEQNLKDPSFRRLYKRERLINAIAKMVYRIRSASGLTQSQLAQKANTTQPVIARLESGSDKRSPSLDLLSKIAEATGSVLNISFKTKH